MEALFNSVVRVERSTLTVSNGVATMGYAQAHDDDPALNDMLQFLRCRLDMNFIREGKDALPAPVAGRAPDRVGLLFASQWAPLRAGDRLYAIPDEDGKIVVMGTFEIRTMPDTAVGFSDAHHIEVQIVEVGQELNPGNWPAEDPLDDEVGP